MKISSLFGMLFVLLLAGVASAFVQGLPSSLYSPASPVQACSAMPQSGGAGSLQYSVLPASDGSGALAASGKPEFDGYIVQFKGEPLAAYIKPGEWSAAQQYQLVGKEHQAALDDIARRLPSGKAGLEGRLMGEYKIIFNGIAIKASEAEIQKIKSSPYVKNVYPNYKVHALLDGSVPSISAPDVWKIDSNGHDCRATCIDCGPCLTGAGVSIAVLDTGVDYTHPDFGGCTSISGCSKVIGGYDFVNDDDDPMDDMGHGTHVAAIAAGMRGADWYQGGNQNYNGVAPEAKIYAYKVLNENGFGSDSDVISGIERATDPNNDFNFSDHADIISMSLGGPGDPDDPKSQSIDNAAAIGVVPVIAAGNSGPGRFSITSPGTARKAITVAANDDPGNMANFSSRGPVYWNGEYLFKPDISAPGVSICAAEHGEWLSDYRCLDQEHISISGTSMAAPHVSGAVALLLQAKPDLTPDEVKGIITGSADGNSLNPILFGFGKLNAANAISYRAPLDAVTSIESPGDVANGAFDVKGTLSQDGFVDYQIYIAHAPIMSDYVEYSLIYNSSAFPTSQYLATNLAMPPAFGPYALKLVANYQGASTVKYGYLSNLKGNDIEMLDGWPRKPFGWPSGFWGVGSTPLLQDVNKDGNKEIITFSSDRVSIWDKNGNALPGWPRMIDTGIMTSGAADPPAIGDINGDGNDEIIKPSFWHFNFQNGKACGYAWNLDGSNAAGWANNCDPSGPAAIADKVSLYDVNNDGRKEILATINVLMPNDKSNYVVHVLNGTGAQMPGWPKTFASTSDTNAVVSPPAAADLNNDGSSEIAVMASVYNVSSGQVNSRMFVYRQNGSLLANFDVGQMNVRESLHLADLDGDGLLEIGLGTSDCGEESIAFYRLDGSIVGGWPNMQYGSNQYNFLVSSGLFSSKSQAGADSGKQAGTGIALSYWSKDNLRSYVTLLSPGGNVLPGWPQETIGKSLWVTPQTADLDSDGVQEVLSTSDSGLVYAWKADGSQLSGFPLDMPGPSNSGTAVGDIDNDGHLELFAGMHDGTVYGWRLKTSQNNYLPWPMWKHDPQNTGVLSAPGKCAAPQATIESRKI